MSEKPYLGSQKSAGRSASHGRRVAHVSLSLSTGGLEKLLVEYARHADRDRFQLDFICLEQRGKLASDVEALGWKVHCAEKRPGFRPALILKLAWLFRKSRVSVVHAHNYPGCFYGVPAARLARVPTVICTWHGQRPEPGTRQSRSFARIGRWADWFVGVSEDVGRLAVEAGLSTERVRTIWNGIDTQRYRLSGPTASGPALFVGRLSPEKNVETLLKAMAIIVQQRPTFRLRLVGDGPSREALEALSSSLGVSGHVEFAGESQDVPEELRRASMFVLPSWTEGISLALLEAMSTGLPVVATRVGGNAEVVADGETGLLVNAGEPRELAEAMLDLAGDTDRMRSMGLAGRKRVETIFDVRAMVRAYEVLYCGGLRPAHQPASEDEILHDPCVALSSTRSEPHICTSITRAM